MPPKIKITKEEIVDTALNLVREAGEQALNARSIAAKLKCSTQAVWHISGLQEKKKNCLNCFLCVTEVMRNQKMTENPYVHC